MIQLAKNGEEMSKVVELIPMLHQGGGELPSLFAEEFVREWYIYSSKLFSHPQTFDFQVVASN
jgi:hypothetical protein